MDISHRRVASGIRAIALLVVSITITAAILVAMLVDTLTAAAVSASAPPDCMTTVHPVAYTIEFVDGRC